MEYKIQSQQSDTKIEGGKDNLTLSDYKLEKNEFNHLLTFHQHYNKFCDL